MTILDCCISLKIMIKKLVVFGVVDMCQLLLKTSMYFFFTLPLGYNNEFLMEPLQNSTTIEESLFCSTTEDGKLNNLQELTSLGQTFLVCCIHLLLKSDSKLLCVNKVKTNSERTWTWIEKRGNFKISKASVLRIIKE